ncbi:mannitol dehydrogenase family protein [Halioxenophilus aromaticivorans]|uniref:Fructuronate reductase n=1 Tax=Halioxenophilus aromaticivorans TaxID=1306992 RepID=A0AAV3UAR2_9ALTE
MTRLSPELLGELPAGVDVPSYDRQKLKPRIVHLGIGAFHRAHQAVYLDDLLNKQGGDWGIVGVSLRSDSVAKQLLPQGGLYTQLEKGAENQFRIIGSVIDVVVAPEDPDAVIQAIADQHTGLVSLTITEKGYCHNPATGTLLIDHPEIQQDITNNLQRPVSAVGFIVAGLKQRYEQGFPGITVLSCDNLPNNGHVLRCVVSELARIIDPKLSEWIDKHVTFPCSMVDRIVPATTDADLTCVRERLGVVDKGVVSCEPFSQWVVQNQFAQPVPDYAAVGVLLTQDVSAYEKIKLRLLNGSHSLIAYFGYVNGFDFVHQVVNQSVFLALIQRYMTEAQSVLGAPTSFDIEGYKSQLIERFKNPALQHQTYQIAMDGSQKIPQRWLETLTLLLQNGRDTQLFALLIAGWITYLQGKRINGDSFEVMDPMAKQLKTLLEVPGSSGDLKADQSTVDAVMTCQAIFGNLSQRAPGLVQQVNHQYRILNEQGAIAAIHALLGTID